MKKILSITLALTIALGVFLSGVPLDASAETPLVVDSTDDTVSSTDGKNTLREALSAAKKNDTITFADSLFTAAGAGKPVVIKLKKALPISGKTVTIHGKVDAKGNPLVTLDAQKKDRVLGTGKSKDTLTLYGLTITGGKAFGEIITSGIESHSSSSRPTTNDPITSNWISSNWSRDKSPVSSNGAGKSAVSSGKDDGSRSKDYASSNGSSVPGGDDYYTDDYASGGGIDTYGAVTLTNCTVAGNSAAWNGGGISAQGTVKLTNCTVKDNTARSYGGGILAYSVILTNCVLPGNSAEIGGGIMTSTATLTNCTLSGNSADFGGGLFSKDATKLTNCTLSGNTATDEGGGINAYIISLTSCTLTGNRAKIGGGVSTLESAMKIYGSIISGNKGEGDIVTRNPGRHSILSLPAAAPSASNYYSIIGTPAGYSLNDIFGTSSPKPADNGGATKTILIKAGGTAHNGVRNTTGWPKVPAEDQRGTARPQGSKLDIGAVELKSSESAPGVRISGTSGNIIVGKTATLKATVYPAGSTDKIATWSSGNTNVATVNNSGKVTAKAPGTVKITVKSAAGKTAAVTITVHRYVSIRIGKTAAIQNGQLTTIDQSGAKPLKISGKTMLPIRFVSEKMGAKVDYVNAKTPIVITQGNKRIELKLGSKEVKVIQNGKTQIIKLEVAAQKIGSRTYLPLRAVGQAMGFDVYYKKDGAAEYVVVNDPKMSAGVKSARIAEAKSQLK